MIDVKQAVQIAKQSALDLLDEQPYNVEEIERETYKDRDVWSITLSIPRKWETLNIFRPSADPLVYRKFLVDAETGEFAAVKMRELASR